VTLHFTYDQPRKDSRKKVARQSTRSAQIYNPQTSQDEAIFGLDWTKLAARIKDRATRAAFLKEMNGIGAATATKHRLHTYQLPMDTTITLHHDRRGDASRGKPTRAVSKPDDERTRELDAVKALLHKYAAALNIPGI
jgi:hypothetical protein